MSLHTVSISAFPLVMAISIGLGVSNPICVLNLGTNPFVHRNAYELSYCIIVPLGTQYEECL